MRGIRTRILAVCAALVLCPHAHADDTTTLHELDFEQLMDLEVYTVSRKAQPLSRTAAAAFVISREDIRCSGATSIPGALRLAPGVYVGQISPSKWSVTIRSFSDRFANKLLVLIDGRTVYYTPDFAGTYWEQQDLLPDDIERIEVIRGPGATLWGSNAVNGTINVITRHASDTHGGLLVTARAGNRDRAAGARWGGEVVSAVVNLGHNLGLKVVAEGIETEGQLAHLKVLDCDFGQGYLIARPLPAGDFSSLLRSRS